MSQASRILAYLKTGETLSPEEAIFHFRCYRLGARVYDLRRAGWNIVDIGPERNVNYSVYKLTAPVLDPACGSAGFLTRALADRVPTNVDDDVPLPVRAKDRREMNERFGFKDETDLFEGKGVSAK